MATTHRTGITPATSLFHKSYKAVMRNINTFGILLLLPFLFALSSFVRFPNTDRARDFGSTIGASGFPVYGWVGVIGLGVMIASVFFVLILIIQAMTYALELEAAKGKTPSLQHLWEVGKKFWLRLFGLGIVVVLFIVGGLILLIVPGLIMIRRYFLAPYIMIDKDLSIGEAMRRSAALTKPYRWKVWGIIGVMFLLSLPGFIPLFGPVIAFVLGALYTVAPAIRYQELKKLS